MDTAQAVGSGGGGRGGGGSTALRCARVDCPAALHSSSAMRPKYALVLRDRDGRLSEYGFCYQSLSKEFLPPHDPSSNKETVLCGGAECGGLVKNAINAFRALMASSALRSLWCCGCVAVSLFSITAFNDSTFPQRQTSCRQAAR